MPRHVRMLRMEFKYQMIMNMRILIGSTTEVKNSRNHKPPLTTPYLNKTS